MEIGEIRKAQDSCLELMKALEFVNRKGNRDFKYENLKVCLHNVNVDTDKVFNGLIFEKEEKVAVEG